MHWYCNGRANCPQGSDEQNCPCEKYSMKNCFMEPNVSLCVPESWICNHYITCLEHSRNQCQTAADSVFRCSQDEFLCHINKTCISQQSVCDGVTNCIGMEDEVYCTGQKCVSTLHKLQNVQSHDKISKWHQKSLVKCFSFKVASQEHQEHKQCEFW